MTALGDRLLERWQVVLAALGLGALPWLVDPGKIQPDTKIDLLLDGPRYLGRSLDAWNAHSGIGELQNQAYGYLWPMGPFSVLGQALHLPDWAIQRAWWSLLLVMALLGTYRVIRALFPRVEMDSWTDSPGEGGRRLTVSVPVALLAAASYALAPRILTVLSHISVEAWPASLAPWLLLAAIRYTQNAVPAPQCAAATSSPAQESSVHATPGQPGNLGALILSTVLLTATLGGVNATASAAALLPPLLWLLTADRSARPIRGLAAWVFAAGAGALWWLGPLAVLGRYAYPFMDYIESAATTTAVTSIPNVLRGSSHWVAYLLTSSDHPVWQSGWVLAQGALGIVGTCLLVGLAFAGLAQVLAGRGMGHLARFCWLSIVGTVLVMTAGRAVGIHGWFAPQVQGLLDGAGSPLRNVHKLDPLLRLPLALGVAVALASWRNWVVRGVVAAAAMGLLAPALQGRIGDGWAYQRTPTAFAQIAKIIDARARIDGGATLLLPNARTAAYTWGRPGDDPIVALAASPIITRASAPLGPPAATRILDRIDDLASTGQAQPQMLTLARQLGITRVVTRSQLALDSSARSAATVEETLRATSGVQLVEQAPGLALWELPAVSSGGRGVSVLAGALPRFLGAPEFLAQVSALVPDALDPSNPLALIGGAADDARLTGAGPVVVTDTLRWRAVNSGRPAWRNFSATLPAANQAPTQVGTKALSPGDEVRAGVTTRVPLGQLRAITATGSADDPYAKDEQGAAYSVNAAIDGDPRTQWRADQARTSAQITIDLVAARPITQVSLRLPRGQEGVGVRVCAGNQCVPTNGAGMQRQATLKATANRIVIHLQAHTEHEFRVTEIALAGVPVGTALRLPDAPRGPVAALAITRANASDAANDEEGSVLRRELPDSIAAQVARRSDAALLQSVTAWAQLPAGSSRGCGAAGTMLIGARAIALEAEGAESGQQRLSACAIKPATAAQNARAMVGSAGWALLPARGVRMLAAAMTDGAAPAQAATARAVRGKAGTGTTGTGKAGAGTVPTAASPLRVSWRSASAGQLSLPAASTARLVVLPIAANAGWQASGQGGDALRTTTVNGWQLAVQVPAGVREVTLNFAPNQWHRLSLLAGLGSVLLASLLGWLLMRRQRGRQPPCDPSVLASSPGSRARTAWPWLAPLGALIVAGVSAGWWGIGVSALTVGLLALSLRNRGRGQAGSRSLAQILGGLLLVGAGVLGALLAALGLADQQALGATLGQLLGVALVTGLLASPLVVLDRSRE